jgi:pilus assembly protein CpaC
MAYSNAASRSARIIIVPILTLIACIASGPPAQGQQMSPRDAQVAEEAAPLTVHLRQSRVIDTPWPVTRVSITDPRVADVQMLNPRSILLQGKTIGSTDLIVWNEQDEGRRTRVDVLADVGRLRNDLRRLFPDAALELSQSEDVLVVNGLLTRAEDVIALHRLLDTAGIKYVDMTRVAGGRQVLIKVRVAEVSRTALRTLGINLFYAGENFFFGSAIGAANSGPINPVNIGVPQGAGVGDVPFTFLGDAGISPAVTLFGGFPGADLAFFLQALAENQYLRILAEPTLVARSGEEAYFLAGGEFPIPVVQGSATAGTSISVEYREFGVRLRFRPIVLGDNIISLFVAPEVSDLTEQGAVQIQGFSIPALITRRAETTLEMRSGQTFAMAGLLSQTQDARNSRVPLLGDIPILGALFRSVRYRQSETELVVLVTASLVEPLSLAAMPPGPGILHVPPNDWELYALGRIQGSGPAKLADADAQRLRELGLGGLRGPGAWSSYGQQTTHVSPVRSSELVVPVRSAEAESVR